VLWAGLLQVSPALNSLAAAIDSLVRSVGVEADRLGFSPHITLGRLRQPLREKEAQSLRQLLSEGGRDLGKERIESFVLFEVPEGTQGGRYQVLERFLLGTTRSP
jgi:2'-5' RNA ligase